ncbi:hypothetical protein WJX84_010015 [Apatococcus fuscideae]|uniref:Uncharacterized protein n=2 Tax=Apatococcus fuscideae TaxID=2026836 RepID=A0AAW1STA6_9CHLO
MYYGEMNVDCWSKVEWLKEWEGHDVMVMTPQILLDILRHGYVMLAAINLLIFDEAHHCVRKDPYNCIMQEFYHDPRCKGSKPHILGMTASPVNVKNVKSLAQVQGTIKVLERNLDSQVLSITDTEAIDRYAPLPKLYVEKYSSAHNDAVVNKATAHLLDIHGELQDLARAQELAWDAAQLRMLGIVDSGLQFDKERHSTQSAQMAKNIMGIISIIEDLGPLSAAAAFVEVIKPPHHNKFRGREHQPLRNGRLETLDGTFMETEDEWFKGMHVVEDQTIKQLQAADKRSQQNSDEWAHVNQLLAKAASALADTIVPSANQTVCIGAGTKDVPAHLPAFRRQVAEELQAIIDQLPGAVLDEHMTGKLCSYEAGWEPPCLLATPRLRKLVFRLLQYQTVCQAGRSQESGTGPVTTPLGWCCIVFVHRKMTSVAIHAILCLTPALKFLTSAPFMGYGGSTTATTLNAKTQKEMLRRFRAGDLNCLVSTSVAEEGLDVRQCQLVIRHDLPSTLLAFIQSRGRARMAASDMVLMVDQSKLDELQFLDDALRYEQQMKDEVQRRQQLEGSLGEGDEGDLELQEIEASLPADQRELYVPATGAKITFASAKHRLYYFCDKLPSDRYTQLRPRFSTEAGEGGQVTKVILPNNSPIRSATGCPLPNKAMATCSACLEALKLLYKAGALNKHLQPETADLVHRSEAEHQADNRRVGVSEAEIDVSEKPDPFDTAAAKLQDQPASSIVHLHLYQFQVKVVGQPEGAVAPNLGQPIGILTLQQLPAFPAFDMLLPRGFSFTSQPASDAPEAADGFWGREKDAAAKHLRTRVQVSLVAIGRQALHSNQVGLLQCWHRAFCRPKFMADEGEKGKGSLSVGERMANMTQTSYVGPQAWAASSHGAYYILAPMQDDPVPASSSGCRAIDWDTVERARQGYEPVLPKDKVEQGDYKGLADRLMHGVIITTYNKWVYFHQRVDWEAQLKDTFETDTLANKKGRGNEDAVDQSHIQLGPGLSKTHEQAQIEKALRKDNAAVERSLKQAIAKAVAEGSVPAESKSVSYEEYFRERWHVTGLRSDQPLLEALHEGRGLQGSAGGKKPIPSTLAGRKRPFAQLLSDDTSTFSFVRIPPELCQLHPLTQNSYLAARLGPYLVWWFFGLLRAMELRDQIVHPDLTPARIPETMLMMEAVTSKACQELICYETLETLGDAFLKFAVSVHLYRLFPRAHEGQLTLRKMAIVSNINLARVGARMGLLAYHALPLDTDSWHPPGLSETLPIKEKAIKYKVVADGVEALLGAYLLAGGLEGAWAALASFNILPVPEDVVYPPRSQAEEKDVGTVGLLTEEEAKEQRLRCKGPERHLKYSFKDKTLMMEAFTHCSWPDPHPQCYQRLEFVGDAVLDLLITRAIVTSYRHIPPGRIHDLRSASVNNGRLACIVVTHDLHCYLRQCSVPLFNHISEFVTSFRSAIDDHQRKQHEKAAAQVSSPQHNCASVQAEEMVCKSIEKPACSVVHGVQPQHASGQDQHESAADADRRLLDQDAAISNSQPAQDSTLGKLPRMDARTAAYNWATSATFGRSAEAPPKALGDLLESITGAVYVDCDYDLETAWKVIGPMMQPMVTPTTVPIHPIRALHERCQRFGLDLAYRTLEKGTTGSVGMEAIVKSTVVGRCEAALNKQLGRKAAAADALQHWDERIKALIPLEKMELIAEEARLPSMFLLE